MKTKAILIFSLFVIVVVYPIQAQQRFRAGIKAGLSTSQFSGDTYSGYDKAGIVGGAFVTARLNENWSGQFEIIYIQKGSRHNAHPDKGDYNYYLLKLDYVEVPLLLQYHQKKFMYEAGPSFGVLIRSNEQFNFSNVVGAPPFNKREIAINLGLGYELFKNIGVSARLSNSLTSVRDFAFGERRWYNPGQLNSVLAFTVTYKFGSNDD